MDRKIGEFANMICRFVILLLLVTAGLAQPKPEPVNPVSSFELPDQHERLRSVIFPTNKPTMFVVSDHKGSKQIESWVRPVRGRYDTRINIDGIADLSPVPKNLRGVVRRAFKDELGYSVMLDWDGKVARKFGYIKDKANIFIVDDKGGILFQTAGAANDAQLKKIFSILDERVQPSKK